MDESILWKTSISGNITPISQFWNPTYTRTPIVLPTRSCISYSRFEYFQHGTIVLNETQTESLISYSTFSDCHNPELGNVMFYSSTSMSISLFCNCFEGCSALYGSAFYVINVNGATLCSLTPILFPSGGFEPLSFRFGINAVDNANVSHGTVIRTCGMGLGSTVASSIRNVLIAKSFMNSLCVYSESGNLSLLKTVFSSNNLTNPANDPGIIVSNLGAKTNLNSCSFIGNTKIGCFDFYSYYDTNIFSLVRCFFDKPYTYHKCIVNVISIPSSCPAPPIFNIPAVGSCHLNHMSEQSRIGNYNSMLLICCFCAINKFQL